jgi:hypothetical protein
MSSLSPELALAYLRELSADFRAGIVLDAAGEALAGDRALHAPAREVLHAHPDARELHAALDDRAQVFVARAGVTIVIVTGPHALGRLTRHDLRTALGETGSITVQDPPPEPLERALAEALVAASAEPFRP